MINYSIPKPHPLCGHFIQINSQEEYDILKQIAEECGFNKIGSSQHRRFFFMPNMEINWSIVDVDFGQQITLSELRELAELSKINLPCKMEVSDDGVCWTIDMVVDFYKSCPVAISFVDGTFLIYKKYRQINPHQAEIDKLEAEIKAIQAKLETLRNSK